MNLRHEIPMCHKNRLIFSHSCFVHRLSKSEQQWRNRFSDGCCSGDDLAFAESGGGATRSFGSTRTVGRHATLYICPFQCFRNHQSIERNVNDVHGANRNRISPLTSDGCGWKNRIFSDQCWCELNNEHHADGIGSPFHLSFESNRGSRRSFGLPRQRRNSPLHLFGRFRHD